jgi:hypothetical protein
MLAGPRDVPPGFNSDGLHSMNAGESPNAAANGWAVLKGTHALRSQPGPVRRREDADWFRRLTGTEAAYARALAVGGARPGPQARAAHPWVGADAQYQARPMPLVRGN